MTVYLTEEQLLKLLNSETKEVSHDIEYIDVSKLNKKERKINALEILDNYKNK